MVFSILQYNKLHKSEGKPPHSFVLKEKEIENWVKPYSLLDVFAANQNLIKVILKIGAVKLVD